MRDLTKKGMKIQSKRKKKLRRWFLVFLFLSSFFYTCMNLSLKMTNEEFVRYLFTEEKPTSMTFYFSKIWNTFLESGLSLNFKNPFRIFQGNYSYHNYSENDSDKPTQSASSTYVKDPYPEKKVEEPKVYLYNTHQLEEYSSKNVAQYNVTPNVMMLSYILREKLNDRNIPTIAEENNVSEFLKANNWSYSASYKATKLLLQDAKDKNPSLEYFIDLHRDSVKRNISATTINGKPYARILFIAGLENPNYQENLQFIEHLNTLFNTHYPGLSRGIYKKQGTGVNGVYNQDFSPRTILIEVGGVENTIDEVFATAEAIADVLERYMKGEQK